MLMYIKPLTGEFIHNPDKEVHANKLKYLLKMLILVTQFTNNITD